MANTWEECSRDDLRFIPFLESRGFTPRFSQEDARTGRTLPSMQPHFPVGFACEESDGGKIIIWRSKVGEDYGWISARLGEDGMYGDHKEWDSALEIINELKTRGRL